MLAAYAASMRARPVLTNAVSGAVVLFVGDAGAQTLEHVLTKRRIAEEGGREKYQYDLVKGGLRSLSMIGWGVISAPVVLHWFRFLERSFPSAVAGGTSVSKLQAAKQIAAHQTCFSSVNNAIFLGYCQVWKYLSGRTRGELPPEKDFKATLALLQTNVAQKLRAEWFTVWVNAALFFAPTQFLNFVFTRNVLFRPVILNACGAVWCIYLSYVAFRDLENAAAASKSCQPVLT